jgi:hypothetical protein
VIYRRHCERAPADDERLLIDEETGTVVRRGLRQILIPRDDGEDEVEAGHFVEEEDVFRCAEAARSGTPDEDRLFCLLPVVTER